MGRAGGRDLLVPGAQGERQQAPQQGPVGTAGAGAVELAGRFDDPGQDEPGGTPRRISRLAEPQLVVGMHEGVPQVPIRDEVIGSGPPPRPRRAGSVRSRSRSNSSWQTPGRCRAAAFSTSSWTSSWADPMCSMSRHAMGGVHDLHRRRSRSGLARGSLKPARPRSLAPHPSGTAAAVRAAAHAFPRSRGNAT